MSFNSKIFCKYLCKVSKLIRSTFPRWNTSLVDTQSFFEFQMEFERLYVDQLTSTFFQTFILWLLAYLTLFIPVGNLNERFMGSVTALLVLASLLGTMEDNLPKSNQTKCIDIWFLCYIINIFLIIIFHVILENLSSKSRKKVNRIFSYIFPAITFVFNVGYFSVSMIQESY